VKAISALIWGDTPIKWKRFEEYWQAKNLKQTYCQKTASAPKFRIAEVDKALCEAVKKSPRLAETNEGKQLLKRYSNKPFQTTLK
jgi:hypothetical protein